MRGPDIISFKKGVIEWAADKAVDFCVLNVNGSETKLEGKLDRYNYKLDCARDAIIKLTAVAGDERATTVVKFVASKQKLKFACIPAVAGGEHIVWNKVSGASSYRVYDLDYSAATVFGTEYDLSDRNIALCVCPDSCREAVESAEPEISDILYLSGAGTESEPYIVKTPFDLRAVEYYETVYAVNGARGLRNHYRIENDIDYGAVDAFESESNMYALNKPFYGTLDGNNKRLVNVRVGYDGGYWALFDYIAAGACVKNIIFENAEIFNGSRDDVHPLDSSVALIAHANHGEISGIKLDAVRLVASGGGVCGIATHNYGRVVGCTVYGELVQASTERLGAASYEMSGVVLENCYGGVAGGNRIKSLVIRGAGNIRSAAGVVSVNRKGGTVAANEFGSVVISGAVAQSEYGGITAYNAGAVVRGGAALGALTVDGERVTSDTGEGNKGKLVGKNDGTAE